MELHRHPPPMDAKGASHHPLPTGYQLDGQLLSLGNPGDPHAESQRISGEAGGSRFSPEKDRNGRVFQHLVEVAGSSSGADMTEPDLSLLLGSMKPPSPPTSMPHPAQLELLQGPPSISFSSRSKSSTCQLTIFYSGVVKVYNDVPADKARAIMHVAASGNSLECPQIFKIPSNTVSQSALKAMDYGTPTSHFVPEYDLTSAMAFSAHTQIKHKQPRRRSYPSDLPYTRKASLLRFLQQRTERVVQAKVCEKEVEDGWKEKEEGSSDLRIHKRHCIRPPISHVAS